MKFLTPFFMLLCIGTLGAQDVILLEEDSVFQINENVDISNNFEEFPLDLFYKNNTNDSILVNWRREFGDNCPLEWDIYTVDQVASYFPGLNESPVPILLSPTDAHFIVRQAFIPRMIPGCCDVKMIFSLEGSPENPIDTGYYHIEINSDECFVTAVYEEAIVDFDIYPNPVLNSLNIKNGDLLKSIEILDLTGKVHYVDRYLSSSEIDTSALPSGIYICKVKSNSGKYLMKKMIKQ